MSNALRIARARLLSAMARIHRQTEPPHPTTREWRAYLRALKAYEAAKVAERVSQ